MAVPKSECAKVWSNNLAEWLNRKIRRLAGAIRIPNRDSIIRSGGWGIAP
ncbi:transposase [Corynebacterium mucifaciens]